ncbi:MAG TPA: molybdenum cofactor guanylyltransferase [Acidobacteriota bacterium]|nr:molybdenum cofactor guanylyltransferase [Acidobacteriota bacterium]
MKDRITGLILAGGKSRRMGRDKARLPWPPGSETRLIDSVIGKMSGVFDRLVLSVQSEDAFPEINLPKVVDRYPETGPLGGIASAFESGETAFFCVACDMPFLNPELIRFLCGFQDCDAVVPVWHGRIESLHAFYSATLLPQFQRALGQGRFRITESFGEGHVKYIHEAEVRHFDPGGQSFRNINTPDEYEQK